MQSVTKLRLFVSPDERRMLFATMERYNAACNAVSPVAFSERQFSNIGLQTRLYRHVRETFGLSAQMTQLAIRKVASSYRSTQEAIKEQNKVLAALGKPLKSLTEISFRAHGAICYDARVLSIGRNRVSIWTLEGRIKLRYSKPAYFPAVAAVKQTDLVYRDGAFWLYAAVETPDSLRTHRIPGSIPVVNTPLRATDNLLQQATEKVRQRTQTPRVSGRPNQVGPAGFRQISTENAGLRPIPTHHRKQIVWHKARSGGSLSKTSRASSCGPRLRRGSASDTTSGRSTSSDPSSSTRHEGPGFGCR